ncbi:lipid-A-disaccharide synthase [Arachidicoccus ginsenosidimutans]|uniref:lipid-A-disaccharide synthase n=1 Tax=Arachidicoccus sp. BS20 TaxID=1850526 RepID=UPI0007F0A100|nr:lipid-A-disaccharide synthase [Arachidicoccus sp. BS20]ANI88967.1 lipid-A-disaccharide synthase [Arachidicoccus sp. BS20]
MKYYIIAGEASGDLHGSNLIKELQHFDHDCIIRCWGGDKMQATGATLVKHYRDLAFMGFVEVAINLRTILKNLSFCKNDIISFQPDVLVLIDYPGFNLRIAEWAKQQNIKVVYYIAPQVWAWKENRVPKMMQSIDNMLVILPFEKDYFKNKFGWNVDYVGHPLVKVIEDFKNENINHSALSDKKIIAVLPGSRKQEVAKKLPVMLQTAKHFPEYQFIVAQAPSLDESFYQPFLSDYPNVSIVKNQTYLLLSNAVAAMVTSGTATLETALFGVPEIVCYKGSNISYQIAKRLIKVKYISLVNLIMDKLVVKELIQNDLTENNLVKELRLLLTDEAKQMQLKNDYQQLKNILSAGGNASANAAKEIVDFYKKSR